MVIHGADDAIVPVTEGRKTRDAYQNRNHAVEFVEIAGLNHFWGTRSDINKQIWEFFQKHQLVHAR